MEKKPIFDQWLEHRQSPLPPDGMAGRITARVEQRRLQGRPAEQASRADRLFALRPVRWALALGASLLGLLRLAEVSLKLFVP